jgi:hypothetical protein
LKHKLDTVWSEPFRIIAVHGSSLELENGQRWNASSCLLHKPNLKQSTRSSPAVSPQADTSSFPAYDDDDADDDLQYDFPGSSASANAQPEPDTHSNADEADIFVDASDLPPEPPPRRSTRLRNRPDRFVDHYDEYYK